MQEGDGETKAEPLPRTVSTVSLSSPWPRDPGAWLCRVVARGDVANYVADAVYSTNSSLLLLLWFVIPHNAATQPELIILTKYTDSGDSHRHQPPSRAQPIC